jgi:hypothetical protein
MVHANTVMSGGATHRKNGGKVDNKGYESPYCPSLDPRRPAKIREDLLGLQTENRIAVCV